MLFVHMSCFFFFCFVLPLYCHFLSHLILIFSCLVFFCAEIVSLTFKTDEQRAWIEKLAAAVQFKRKPENVLGKVLLRACMPARSL